MLPNCLPHANKISTRFLLVLAVVIAFGLAAAPEAQAQATITVNDAAQVVNPGPGGPGVGGNGDSLCQLSEAILAANSDAAVDGCAAGSVAGPDTIIVPAGTYTLSQVDVTDVATGLPFGLPRITSNIIITGAGAINTIIERQAGAASNFAFLIVDQTLGNLTLNNLTFRNGSQGPDGSGRAGGAIFNANGNASALAINNCVFDGNTGANGNGGAVLNGATINNTTFINNTVTVGGSGGAIALACNCTLVITNSTFTTNSSANNRGGAIQAESGGTVTISNSVFTNNSSKGGGAIVFGGNVVSTVNASIFSGNTDGFVCGGGAIAIATACGGSAGFVTVAGSTFLNNTGNRGGGIASFVGALNVRNSTFSGNSAAFGGGILSSSVTVLNNVTIVNNIATSGVDGGGIEDQGTSITLSNTIIARNTSLSAEVRFIGASTTSLGFNIIGDNSGSGITPLASDLVGTSANPIDPVISLLGINGGTVLAGSGVGGQAPQVVQTFGLLIGSPALNAGNPAAPTGVEPACEVTGQNGVARPQGASCDIGAFENPGGTGIIPNMSVSVTKSDAPDPVLVNNNVTYTITVSNNGPDPATGVSLNDPLPVGLNLVSFGVPAFWSFTNPPVGTNGTVTATTTSMDPGTSVIFTIVATVTGTAVSPVANTVTVTTTGNDTNLTDNSATATTTVTGTNIDLTVTKTDSPDPVNVGAVLTYTITVSNAGPGGATGVTLTDPLPANVAFGVATPSQGTCNQAAGIVSCNLGAIANGANATITITVTPGALAAPSISNTASATAAETDNNPADNSQTISTTVNPIADISVTKTDAPDPVNVGANLTYTITVTNNGPSAAASASLSDPLPAGVNFVSLASAAGWACTTPAVGANGTVSCTNPSVANGASDVFTLVVTPSAAAAAAISNTATVSAATTDPTPANNSQSASTTVNPVADLSVTKTDAPDPVSAGSNLTYTITVNNAGPSAAAGVNLNDTLPAGTTFVSLTSAAGWLCTTPAVGAGGTVTCTIASLASGASAVFTLVANTSVAATLNNTATVATTTTDPSAANNSATASTTVSAAVATDFTISAVPLQQGLIQGQSVAFAITLTPTPAGAAFNNPIQLSVQGNQAVGFVVFSQTSVTPGATPASVTMTVTFPPRNSLAPPAPLGPQLPLGWLLLGALAAATLALLARRQRVPRKLVPALALLLLVLGGVLMQSACATGDILSGPKTITVTGTSGALSHSVPVIVTLP